jgi:outer membrane protein OmpA-like peptidoglycan-associated protein
MKTLIIGFFVLLSWSALSTHIYVCKIKGLCNEREPILMGNIIVKNGFTTDSLPNTLTGERVQGQKNHIIYFKFDYSEFNSDAETDKYSFETNAFLAKNSQSRLCIVGYTDAIGSDEYNQSLGFRRAQSVKKYFESKGIPSGRILLESKGEKEPVADNITDEGRSKNRRTVITIKY